MSPAGQIIGHRYRVAELIGTGGMSYVYRAITLATVRRVARLMARYT